VPAGPGTLGAATVVPAYTQPAHAQDITRLLQHNAFDTALERYAALQAGLDERALADARRRILSRARELLAEGRFGPAEQLLQRFLVTGYRDVEARLLLAEAYRGQQDDIAAIDTLYEARGHAWRPAMLERITGRIRSLVAGRVRSLKQDQDRNALLALYRHLVEREPDHAPWFLGLAATQLALDDREAARRSLQLVAQDPAVGAQARALLAELDIARVGMQDTAADAPDEVAGIPLHRSGHHFLVDARPARGRSVRLLIDTGASLTIFTPGALEQRGIRYRDTGRTGVFLTANGPVQAPVYQLDSLAVGGWQVADLDIGVLDLDGGTAVDGLLGMNFLRHFRFFIDQHSALLRLSVD
jgi:clan AA aspartic protease (TIGR02281 family)